MMNGRAVTAGAAFGLTAFVLDQATKAVIFDAARPGVEIVVASFFSITPGHNSGVAFGMAAGAAPWVLIAVGLALSAGLAALLTQTGSVAAGAALGAAIGGALGNIADRLRFGAVRDFIDFHWGSTHWPAFNIADASLVTGLLLFVMLAHRDERRGGGGKKSRREKMVRVSDHE